MDPLTIMSAVQAGGSLLGMLGGNKAAKKASKEYQKYVSQIMSSYAAMAQPYKPGAAFERKGLSDIAQAKTSYTGSAMNRLIASGMAGGETGLGVESAFEKTIGIPGRLTLEDLRTQRLNEIEREKNAMLGGMAEKAYGAAGAAGEERGKAFGSLIQQGGNLLSTFWPAKQPKETPATVYNAYGPKIEDWLNPKSSANDYYTASQMRKPWD